MTIALKTMPTRYEPWQRSSQHLRRNSVPLQPNPVSTQLTSFKRHEHLSFVHYRLWRIHTGYIRTITWNAEGECVPLGFWSAGDVIGYPIAQTYPYEAECLTTVEAEYLNVDYPLSREMVLNQIRQSNSLLRIIHCRDAERRILQFICWLAGEFGIVSAEGIHISMRLTHQEIAESVGATRVTVSRLLKSLERKGHLIWKVNKKLVLRETFDQCYLHRPSA